MKLRPIALTLASAALVSGFIPLAAGASTAQASTARATSSGPKASHPAVSPASAGEQAGVITGIVAGTGHGPLTGACVIATGAAGSAMAMTGTDGRYVLTGLHPGSYKLHVSDCSAPGAYFDQWSGGAMVATQAHPVIIAAGQVKSIARITLRSASASSSSWSGAGVRTGDWASGSAEVPGLAGTGRSSRPGTSVSKAGTGAISGTVTANGKPLEGICVIAFGPRVGRMLRTSKAGTYTEGNLRPGKYLVRFTDCPRSDSNWLAQYYRNASGFGPGNRPVRVRVTAGKTTRGIDASMQLGGQLSGTVRAKSGKLLGGICIEAIGRAGRRFDFGYGADSAKNGRYVLHALEPAKYQVAFFRECGNKGNYAPQWWRDTESQAHAANIPVASGAIVRNIDAALLAGGAITGVVRGKSLAGPRLSGVCVEASPTSRPSFGTLAFTTTAKDGSYKLTGLVTGRYSVRFTRCRNKGNYLPAKRTARVTVSRTLRRFNVALPPGAIISGVVTDVHGNPVGGICVQADGQPGGFGGIKSKADGSYSIDAMPTGKYSMQFTGGCGNTGSYAPQFYHGQTNSASANLVTATAGQVTSGIDAAMQPGGTVTGTVTDSGGAKLSDICIALSTVPDLRFGFFFGGIAFTKDGTYTESNLKPGLYSVAFNCFGERKLARTWFRSQTGVGTADLVSAPAGVITSGISSVLPAAGSITGAVTNRSGQPLPRICVRALPVGSMVAQIIGPQPTASTNKLGSYTLTGLAPGSYQVQFSSCGRPTYGGRWYQAKNTEQSATPVTVASGAATTGINEVLRPGGSISGQVKSASGQPLQRQCVEARNAAGGFDSSSITNKTGHYAIGGLATGSYQVSVEDCFFRGTPHASATRPGAVQVTGSAAVTGINIRVGQPGSISGRVLGGPAGTPQFGVCVVAVPVTPGDSLASTGTENDGAFRLTGLGAGQYQVYFGDPFCLGPETAANEAPAWYDDKSTQASAQLVTVVAGADTSNIGDTLRGDGTISGTVITHHHAPVAGECVTAFPDGAAPDPLAGEVLAPAIAVTASDGSYSIVGLLPGRYTVEFTVGCGDAGYQTQWWRHAGSATFATPVTVPASGTASRIDAFLHQ